MKCFICSNENKFIKLFPSLCSTHNYLCQNCGLVFIPERKGSKNYYKKDGYYKKSPNKGLRKIMVSKGLLTKLGIDRLKEIDSRFNISWENKSVLDVGCGYGHLLYAIEKKYGCKVKGLEPSPEVAKIGKGFFGIEIVPEVLEKFSTDEKFDIVLCNHTLEHVDDPPAFLELLKKLIPDDGAIYIEVPNIMKPSGGYNLETFLYQEHLQTFSERNLEILFNNCGLGVINYNNDNFLRFFVQKEKNLLIKTAPQSANQVYKFLREYKNNYNIFNSLNVYFKKLLYLLKVIRYKVLF